jgi:hypothetical protein
MKNKPYPALLGGSYLFNEIKKWTPKSRETILLKGQSGLRHALRTLAIPTFLQRVLLILRFV